MQRMFYPPTEPPFKHNDRHIGRIYVMSVISPSHALIISDANYLSDIDIEI